MYRSIATAGLLAATLWAAAASAATSEPAGTLPPAAATVHIKNFRFDPARMTVHAGERVSFVNDDAEAHTATASDRSFDSAGLDSGATWQHVFDKAGSYAYFCELHPMMKGTIVVVSASRAAQP